MTAHTKIPPLPQEVRDRYKPFRHKRDKQDELFDNGGMKAPRIRVEREDVIADQIEDPVAEQKRAKGQSTVHIPTAKAHRVQSRLERMKKRGEIDKDQWEAGERFALDVELSGGSAKSCLQFDIGGGDPELAALYRSPHEAAKRVARAMNELGLTLWPLVVWVAVSGRPANEWVEQQGLGTKSGVGTAMLKRALQVLVEHYGIGK